MRKNILMHPGDPTGGTATVADEGTQSIEPSTDAASAVENLNDNVDDSGETSEAPADSDDPKPKARKKKIEYPGLKDKDGNTVKYGGDVFPPEDFDPNNHVAIRRDQVVKEHLWCQHRAEVLKAESDRYFQEAEQLKNLGTTKDPAAAKRLIAMQAQMASLRAQMKSNGMTDAEIDALLGVGAAS